MLGNDDSAGGDTMTETPMIRAEDLRKTVTTSAGPLHILRGIGLSIKAGESVAVVGASGSGKSTLLGLLAGLDLPSAGSVWLGGRDITALDEDQRAQVRAELVGFVFQSFQLLPSLTALENVMLPLELQRSRGARAAAVDYLQRVGLGARQQHYPRQLSGGEQQRVAIARAFASAPKILFADEPTGNLDTATGAHICDLLFDLNRETDTTLVLVTHEERLAARCSRRIELAAGAIDSDSAAGTLRPAVGAR
jgi:putative ABC transport system ATP-binding protein